MKIWMISLLTLIVFSSIAIDPGHASAASFGNATSETANEKATNEKTANVNAAPSYAKWGTIAVKETQKRYNASIVDYKHIGRKNLSPQMSEEQFKLWIRNNTGKEFGVYVFIQFDPSTDKLQTIRFSESNR